MLKKIIMEMSSKIKIFSASNSYEMDVKNNFQEQVYLVEQKEREEQRNHKC